MYYVLGEVEGEPHFIAVYLYVEGEPHFIAVYVEGEPRFIAMCLLIYEHTSVHVPRAKWALHVSRAKWALYLFLNVFKLHVCVYHDTADPPT